MTEVTEDEAVRFSEYLEDEMSAEDRRAFEAELAADERLRTAFEEFRATLDALGTLARVEPVDLAEGVRTRIRRRSRGRYFGRRSEYRERVQTQIFLVVALAVLAAAAFLGSPSVFRALFDDEFVLVEDGSGDGSGDVPRRDDTPSEPEGTGNPGAALDELPPVDGSLARTGSVGDMPIRPMVHREYRYTVHATLDDDALGRRLRDQFGPSAVAQNGTAWRVAVPRAEVPAVLERVGDLGPVTRELVDVAGARATLDIVFETGHGADQEE